MHLPSGTHLGPYRIEALIGAGGMGEVYRATDTRLKRGVAVKVLSSRLTMEPSAKRRFEREAHTASALNNPHICTIYDVGEHEGQQFLVMELLEGQTLKQYMDGRALAVGQALKLGIQIAGALQTAQGKGNHSSGSQAREYFCHVGRGNQSARLWLGKITPANRPGCNSFVGVNPAAGRSRHASLCGT